jgi:ParB family chromosome partitioning protein
LRLLKLPDMVRQALAEEKISEGHARALLGLNTANAQISALTTVLVSDLTVRQTEDLVRRLNGERKARLVAHPVEPEIEALEERLRGFLGTKVTLNHGKKGGSLVIHYYSDEELNGLIGRILKE